MYVWLCVFSGLHPHKTTYLHSVHLMTLSPRDLTILQSLVNLTPTHLRMLITPVKQVRNSASLLVVPSKKTKKGLCSCLFFVVWHTYQLYHTELIEDDCEKYSMNFIMSFDMATCLQSWWSYMLCCLCGPRAGQHVIQGHSKMNLLASYK